MLSQAMDNGEFHQDMTKGSISHIPKEGDLKDLDFWRPITLLTVLYKIFAKTMQLSLQPLLMEIISLEQSAFLPLRYILDNIVLVQETLQWAKSSNQPTVFLKLDFSKAYDKVSWPFLFKSMSSLGIHESFIKWTKMLFNNARASVTLDGTPGKEFRVERGVRQGCPLAPYLFLIVGETLNHIIKKAMREGRIHGVKLPGGKQQCISQYADDTSFLIKREKSCIDEVVRLLGVFSRASGMEINWHKSCAYWFDRHTPKPLWLRIYNWTWEKKMTSPNSLEPLLVSNSRLQTWIGSS